jgi:hypothetical protein
MVYPLCNHIPYDEILPPSSPPSTHSPRILPASRIYIDHANITLAVSVYSRDTFLSFLLTSV